MKFQTKLVISIVILITISATAIVTKNTFTTINIYENNMKTQADNFFENFSNQTQNAKDFELIVDNLMEEKILNAVEALSFVDKKDYSNALVNKITKKLNVDEYNIVNKDRYIKFSNFPDYIDWQYPKDHEMNIVFSGELDKYSEPVRINAIDGNAVKYGGMKLDNGYYVQVGITADTIAKLQDSFRPEILLNNIVENNKDTLYYALIVDENEEIFASTLRKNNDNKNSTDESKEKFANPLVKKSINNKKTYSETIVDSKTNNKTLFIYKPWENGKDVKTVVFAISTKAIDSSIKFNIISSILTTIVIVIISIIILLVLVKSIISKPIKIVENEMSAMATYEFIESENTRNLEKFTQYKDDIGSMARGLTQMKENIISLVGEIIDKAQNTAATAEELTATAQNTSSSAKEVAHAVNNISEGANSQAEDTLNAAGNIEESGRILEELNSILNDLASSVNEINTCKEEGKLALSHLLEIASENEKEAKYVGRVITETNESAEAISKASEMIQSIADQTNLLALNAAIEAARAGEAGKGFAVVAEEIRKLAEDSSKFTDEIRTVIEELKEKTENAVKSMEIVGKKMVNQDEKANITQDKFEDIDEAVTKSNRIFEELKISSKNIQDKNNAITEIIENLSAIAQENAATTEEAFATVESQVASIEDISKASENMAQIATELQEDVSDFKL